MTNFDLVVGIDTGPTFTTLDRLDSSLTKVGTSADRVLAQTTRLTRENAAYGTQSDRTASSVTRVSSAQDRLVRSSSRAETSVSRLRTQVTRLAAAYISVQTARAAINSSLGASTLAEDELVAIAKTTGIVGSELERLDQTLTDLSTGSVPVSTSRLREIATVSGQLGVEGVDNIATYAETLGRLERASDLAGAEGAKSLTRILKVQGEASSEIERLASVVVELGNNSAASESEIANVAAEVARGTAQFRIGSTEVAAYSAAFVETGTQAELAGTVLGRTMREIQSAVSAGGDQLGEFARVAGVSVDEFVAAWEEDGPVETVNLVLQGLARFGQDAGAALEAIGLPGDRAAKVLPALAVNFEILEEKQRLAREEAENMVALQKESDLAFSTTSADLARLANVFRDTARAMGDGMSPAVRELADELSGLAGENRELARLLGEDVGAALKTIVDLVKILAAPLKVIHELFGVLNAALAVFVGLKVHAALGAMAASAGLAAGSIAALAAPIAVVAGAGVLAFGAINRVIQQTEKEMEDLVKDAATLGDAFAEFRGAEEFAKNAEDAEVLQTRIDQLTSQIEAEQATLESATAEFERHGAEIDRLVEKYGRWPGQMPTGRLEELRELQAGFNTEIQEANSIITFNEKALEVYGARMSELEEETVETSVAVDDLNKKKKEQRERFEQTLDSIVKETESLIALAAAHREAGSAAEDALDAVRLEQELRGLNIDLLEDQEKAIRSALEARRAAEREASGAETISNLERELKAQRDLTVATSQGSAAAAKAKRALEIEEAQRQATAGAAEEQRVAIENLVRLLRVEEDAQGFLVDRQAIEDEIESLRLLTDEYRFGAQAVENYIAASRAEQEVIQATTGYFGEQADEIRKLARERVRLAAEASARSDLAALEREVDALEELAEIRKEDFRNQREYLEALRELNIERETSVALMQLEADRSAALSGVRAEDFNSTSEYEAELRRINALFDEIAGKTRTNIRLRNELLDGFDNSKTTFEDMADAADIISEALQGIDSELAAVVEKAAELAEAFDLAGTNAEGISIAQAGAELASVIADAVSGPNNYAAEGSVVGAIVGAIISAYFTGDASSGAAVGAAAGSALGSLIKKGSDEFLGSVTLAVDDAIVNVQKEEGKLGQSGRKFLDAISRGINEAVDLLGGDLINLPQLEVKIRDGIFTVFSQGIEASFASMQEAIDFAILMALKEGAITGISKEVQAVLENTTAESFAALAGDLDFARFVERLPEVGEAFSQTAVALDEAFDDYLRSVRKASDLGIELGKIDQNLLNTLGNVRNGILGITETAEERIRREAEAFNREVDLFRAEAELRKADIEIKIEQAKVNANVLDLDIRRLEAAGSIFQAKANLAQAEMLLEAEVVNAKSATLIALERALASVNNILANLPDLINEQEIQDAIRRAGGGGRGNAGRRQRREERERINEELAELHRTFLGVGDGANSLIDDFSAFDEWIENARRLGFEEERLSDARKMNAEIIAREFLEEFQDNARRAAGESELEIDFSNMVQNYVESVQEAWIIANEMAEAFGTEVGDEYQRLIDTLGESFGFELSDLFGDEIERLIADGDSGGLSQLLDQLGSFGDDLPPELKAIFDTILPDLVDQAEAGFERIREGLLEGVEGFLDDLKNVGEFERRLRDMQKTFGDSRKGLLDLIDAQKKAGLSTDQLARDLADLDAAEQLAAQRIAFDFIPSLTNLGIALPVEVTQELAMMQFELARAEAISAAAALAAAGAFDGLSFTLAELLELIAGAEFELSPFNPQFNPNPPTGGGSNSAANERERFLDRLDRQIREWNSLGVGSLTLEAIELQQTAEELRAEARRLGISRAQLNAAFNRARQHFIDDILEPYERIGESGLARELREITEFFLDAQNAFEEIGASAQDMARLEAARLAALQDFWDRATEGLRAYLDELQGNDPRRTGEEAFLDAQAEFRELAALAATGDLDAIEALEAAARAYQEQAELFLGSGVGSLAVFDEITGVLQSILDMDISTLEDNPILDEAKESNDLLDDIRAELRESNSRPDPFDPVVRQELQWIREELQDTRAEARTRNADTILREEEADRRRATIIQTNEDGFNNINDGLVSVTIETSIPPQEGGGV